MRVSLSIVFSALLIAVAAFETLPKFVHAQGGASVVSNITCNICVQKAIAQKKDPYITCKPVVCTDPTNGVTTGHCELTQCHADKFSGAGQSGGTGLDQVMKALGELFGKLMSQPPPPPTPPSSMPPPTSQTNTGGCLGNSFDTSDVSQLSNPCARYVPPTSNNILPPANNTGGCSLINQVLGLCTGTTTNQNTTTSANLNTNTNTSQNINTILRATTSTTTTATTPTTPLVPFRRVIFATTTSPISATTPPGGARGDIQVTGTGATVVAGTRDVQNNTEVAGFYGTETFGENVPQGLVGQWCQSRPWASNFLSKIVAPSFFDGLCAWRGYPVGTPPAATSQAPVLTQTPRPKPVVSTSTPATTTPTIQAKVDIWAVPATVSLGSRTSIFWNTQGVTNCTETSPDGSFNQSSLSGGSATVPIISATTFTISCIAPDGSHQTAFVTVNLKI
ncbi:MAG: hypothetical protein Q7S50_02795 [bacterium]|nr:hypothetical protein [bacterium]